VRGKPDDSCAQSHRSLSNTLQFTHVFERRRREARRGRSSVPNFVSGFIKSCSSSPAVAWDVIVATRDAHAVRIDPEGSPNRGDLSGWIVATVGVKIVIALSDRMMNAVACHSLDVSFAPIEAAIYTLAVCLNFGE
jgi:hypothetical protein